jgi:hypothetical protein
MYKLLYYNCVSFIKAENAYPTGAPDPVPGFWCSLPFSLCDVPLPSVFSVVCCAYPCYLGLVIVSGLLLPLQWRYFLFSSQWQCFVRVSLLWSKMNDYCIWVHVVKISKKNWLLYLSTNLRLLEWYIVVEEDKMGKQNPWWLMMQQLRSDDRKTDHM